MALSNAILSAYATGSLSSALGEVQCALIQSCTSRPDHILRSIVGNFDLISEA
jgi:hypothetical protein